MISLLYAGSSSACIEILNGKPFRNDSTVPVRLNGRVLFETDRNVFTLYGLKPSTKYRLEAGEESLSFTTRAETACYSAVDFGAVGDGKTLNTAALQTAINFLPEGGRLVLPTGQYLTGALMLKSHMTLELEEGAVLLGSTDKADYPVVPGNVFNRDTEIIEPVGIWEGNAYTMRQALLCAAYSEDITVVGPGTVDGNAQNADWWIRPIPTDIARPRLAFLSHCRNVTFLGFTGRNSAAWNFHPYYSEDINFFALQIEAPKDSPNTDGIDPEACDLVRIIGCVFSVGDDCIAIKSGKRELEQRIRRTASRHLIRNCRMQFGHGAVTLGSEIAGGVRDLTVNSCEFYKTDRGLRIKTRRGRGEDSVIDQVVFENIRMKRVLTPIVMNMWYNCNDPDRFSDYVKCREPLPVDERTPRLGSFVFRDMDCEECEVTACYCDGLPEQPIGSVTLENLRFSFAEDAKPEYPAMQNDKVLFCKGGLYFDNVKDLHIKNVSLTGVEGDELRAYHVGSITRE